ncbi:fungal specific transcription factor domain-containing protein [Aspergillus undulatus]|uniref:fungal specific transcription factor domain-containing protein n=1 Tax=Aspergillus undulatus TaxID=1810928 RepID=UPI003CCDEE0C
MGSIARLGEVVGTAIVIASPGDRTLISPPPAPPLSVVDYPADLGQSLYPLVLTADVSWLPPQEVAYLNSQQALTLPKKEIIHTLLRYYFLHFHPLFPVVKESEFRESTIYGKPFSLLVFRAMLFAATHHTPVECAQDAGYTSIAHLRSSLYRSAKSLYDLGIEKDHFHIAQAALLLSDHFDYADPMGNTAWLAIAVQHARHANAHLKQMLQVYDVQKYRLSDLKRLWWCFFLQDRVCSLSSRRPLVVTLDQFDPSSADHLDISEVWDNECESFDAPMRAVLHRVLISQCRLATYLTPHVMSANHTPDLIGSNVCVEKEKALVMEAIWDLAPWDDEYEELVRDKVVIGNLAVAVNVHLTSSMGDPRGAPSPQISLPVHNTCPPSDPSSWHKNDHDSGSTSLDRLHAATITSQQTMQEWASELEEFMGPLFGL